MRHRIEQRTNTIARQFDRVCEVLEELDYLEGESVTPAGAALARIYSELDLVAAECLRQGIWDGPGGAGSGRGAVRPGVRVAQPRRRRAAADPGRRRSRRAVAGWCRSSADLDAVEREHRLSLPP